MAVRVNEPLERAPVYSEQITLHYNHWQGYFFKNAVTITIHLQWAIPFSHVTSVTDVKTEHSFPVIYRDSTITFLQFGHDFTTRRIRTLMFLFTGLWLLGGDAVGAGLCDRTLCSSDSNPLCDAFRSSTSLSRSRSSLFSVVTVSSRSCTFRMS